MAATEFDSTLPSFTGFYWVLLGFTGFYQGQPVLEAGYGIRPRVT